MNRVVTALGNKFAFTVANTSGGAVIVALLAAYFNTLAAVAPAGVGDPIVFNHWNPAAIVGAGYACNVVADDGTPIPNVVCTAAIPAFTIRQFREYVKLSGGLVCKELVIQANNVDVFEQIITVIKTTPLSGSAPQYLQLSDFKSVDQQANDKIVIRNIDMELAFDTLMLMTIANNRTVTFSFKF